MLTCIRKKIFGNGVVYHLQTKDGFPVETTDTFLPIETIDAVGRKSNALVTRDFGSRNDRWMIGVSVMSGCPVGCKFCATGGKFNRNLSVHEIIEQVNYIIENNDYDPRESKEFKILFTRMGEPLLNVDAVCDAIQILHDRYPFSIKAISTVGIRVCDAMAKLISLSSKIPNIQLQISLHTTSETLRNELLGQMPKFDFNELRNTIEIWRLIPNNRNRKVTLNFTLVEGYPFDINILKEYFNPEDVFIKLSPLNENRRTIQNNLRGVIKERNLL